MLHIDHISLGVANLYEGTFRFMQETGLGHYDGGWFPSINGLANKIVPLGNDQYVEVESIIDHTSRERDLNSEWFSTQIDQGDVFIGWCVRVDTKDELEDIARRLDVPIEDSTIRANFDGTSAGPLRTPDTMTCWRRGLPNFFWFSDLSMHPARKPAVGGGSGQGIAWLEVGGTEADMRAWAGSNAANMPLRFNGLAPGLYAMALRTSKGDIQVIRKPAVSMPAAA